jgi:curved DNA-binding protein CbpA
MQTHSTYYDLLGVSPKASDQQIKESYQELVRRYHPDRNQQSRDTQDVLKALNIAYRTLSRPEERANYDSWLIRSRGSQSDGISELGRARGAHLAAPVATEGVSSDAKTSELAVASASKAYLCGDFAGAAILCRKALRFNEKNVSAHVLLGDVHTQLKNHSEAYSSYRNAMRLGDDSTVLRVKTERAAAAMRGVPAGSASSAVGSGRPRASAAPAPSPATVPQTGNDDSGKRKLFGVFRF